jgi:hypothetical protein
LSLTLNYNATTVILPNPNFGDIKRFTSQRLFRRMKGGNRKIFKDPNWPVVENFVYEVSKITTALRNSLIAFFQQSLGQEITLTDHYGIQRTGYIVTPSAEIVTTRADGCSYDISFEFMANEISFLIGDCEGSTSIVSPNPGDSDPYLYNRRIDDLTQYEIQDENDITITDENNGTMYIEGY